MLCLAIAVQATPLQPDSVETQQSRPTVQRRTHVNQTMRRTSVERTQVTTTTPAATADTIASATADTIATAAVVHTVTPLDSLAAINLTDSTAVAALGQKRVFNPNPTTALWMSALCPGLGQVYNRRYWKLPIVVGAFVGLSYGTSWNNRMFQDYSKAYRDAMDNDPETRSYMHFYPPNVKESDLDMEWLKKALKNKKDYYRRYRDICVLAMVGVYALSIIDAYVDASLAHFDISPELSMQLAPTVIDNQYSMSSKPSLGVQCSINF